MGTEGIKLFASAIRGYTFSEEVNGNIGVPCPIETRRCMNSSCDSCRLTDGERDRLAEGDLEYDPLFSYEDPLGRFSLSLDFLFVFDCSWGKCMFG